MCFMSIYRNEAESNKVSLETIKAGCPVCRNDVKGDDVYLFYCPKCRLIYKREELDLSSVEHVTAVMKEKIAEKYYKNKGLPDIDDNKNINKLIKIKDLNDNAKNILAQRKIYYFASKQSNIVHASNCPYAKNIKRDNRLRFQSLENANNYKKCKCITEIK